MLLLSHACFRFPLRRQPRPPAMAPPPEPPVRRAVRVRRLPSRDRAGLQAPHGDGSRGPAAGLLPSRVLDLQGRTRSAIAEVRPPLRLCPHRRHQPGTGRRPAGRTGPVVLEPGAQGAASAHLGADRAAAPQRRRALGAGAGPRGAAPRRRRTEDDRQPGCPLEPADPRLRARRTRPVVDRPSRAALAAVPLGRRPSASGGARIDGLTRLSEDQGSPPLVPAAAASRRRCSPKSAAHPAAPARPCWRWGCTWSASIRPRWTPW